MHILIAGLYATVMWLSVAALLAYADVPALSFLAFGPLVVSGIIVVLYVIEVAAWLVGVAFRRKPSIWRTTGAAAPHLRPNRERRSASHRLRFSFCARSPDLGFAVRHRRWVVTPRLRGHSREHMSSVNTDKFTNGRPAGVTRVTRDGAGRLTSWVENGFSCSVRRDASHLPVVVRARSPNITFQQVFAFDGFGRLIGTAGDVIPTVFLAELCGAGTGSGGSSTTVVNDLTTGGATDALSAQQGVVLKGLVDGLAGALRFQTTWNASTNSPALPTAASGNAGHYWVVSVAGSTSQGGITDWQVGDWVISDGATYTKIDNSDLFSDAAVRSAVMTGMAASGTALPTASDTTLSAFSKFVGWAGNLATNVLSVGLTGLSTSTNSAITASDSILVATGKLQAQINAVVVGGGGVQDSLTPGSSTVSPSVDAVVGGLATKRSDLGPVAVTAAVDCDTDLGDGSTHANRPLYVTANGDVDIAITGGSNGDSVEVTARGTGEKTFTGVTVPAGCTDTITAFQVFTAIRDNGVWLSTTPDFSAVATGGGSVPYTVTGATPIGSTLTVTVADGWQFSARQWTRDGVDIGSATGATYVTIEDDAEATVTCELAGIPYVPAGVTVDAAPTFDPAEWGETTLKAQASGPSRTHTFASPTTAGSAVAIIFGLYSYNHAGDDSTITVVGNLVGGGTVALTRRGTAQSSAPTLEANIHSFSIDNAPVLESITVGTDAGFDRPTAAIIEAKNAVFDAIGTIVNTSISGSARTASITTGSDDALVFAYCACAAAPSAVSSGYAQQGSVISATFILRNDAPTGVAGSKSVGFTPDTSATSAILPISFKTAV